MVVQSELSRIKTLLTEAVTVLCKNALSFGSELSIEGLLGITLDKQDVFLVSINETSRKDFGSTDETEDEVTDAPEGTTSCNTNNENHSTDENDKPVNYDQPSASVRVKQEYRHQSEPIILDGDTPEDLSRVGRSRKWSPSRKRHKSRDTLYADSCEPLSCTSDSSMNPLDLIIKHERFSESDCENMKNDISRQFNLSHPASGAQTSSDASFKDDTVPRDVHLDKSPQEDNNSDSSLNSTGWAQETAPFCIPGNLLPTSNQTPFASAIGTQSLGQIPMLGSAIFQQFNLGASVSSLMKNHHMSLSALSLSRRSSLSSSGGRTFTCHICAKVVRTNQALRDHIATHEQTKRYRCPHCDQQFVHRSSLANHRRKCLAAMQQDFYEYSQAEKT